MQKLFCTVALYYLDYSFEYNLYIKSYGTVVNVVKLGALALTAFISTVVSAVYDPKTDHSGLDGEELLHIFFAVF